MSRVNVTIDGQLFEIELPRLDPGTSTFRAVVNGQEVAVAVPELGGFDDLDWITVDGRPHEIEVDRQLRWLRSGTSIHWLEVRDLDAVVARPVSGDARVKAPIPGLIVKVCVGPGDRVEPGQPLLLLEAMKMENAIAAPRAGVVGAVSVAEGQTVALGEILVEIV